MTMSWTALLSCLCSLTALVTPYPLYGPKRYRTYSPPPPVQFPVFSPRTAYPPAYNPYSQDVSAEFYPQELYDGRYRFVQVPYYFPEPAPGAAAAAAAGPGAPPSSAYYYDDEDPGTTGPTADELTDVLSPDDDLEPYFGDWYTSSSAVGDPTNAKVNAYFLKNLILAEMYRDAQLSGQAERREDAPMGLGGPRYPVTYGYQTRDEYLTPREDYDDFVYGEQVGMKDPAMSGGAGVGGAVASGAGSSLVDEDVSQLKSLVASPSAENAKRQQQLKKEIQSSKTRFSGNTWSPEKKRTNDKKGQDEVVLPRPANSSPLRSTTGGFHQRVHEPSAYDAIKKLLHATSQQKNPSSKKKRSYIPNEDALVEQLDNLKKSA